LSRAHGIGPGPERKGTVEDRGGAEDDSPPSATFNQPA
jgi:hypothetical protein